MEFRPDGAIEAMLAGHCVMFHEMIVDSVRTTMRGEEAPASRVTCANIIAMDKAFGDNLTRLERHRRAKAAPEVHQTHRDEDRRPRAAAPSRLRNSPVRVRRTGTVLHYPSPDHPSPPEEAWPLAACPRQPPFQDRRPRPARPLRLSRQPAGKASSRHVTAGPPRPRIRVASVRSESWRVAAVTRAARYSAANRAKLATSSS